MVAPEIVQTQRPRWYATVQRAGWLKIARYAAGAFLAPLVPPILHAVLSGHGDVPGHEDKAFAVFTAGVVISYAASIPLGAILLAVLAARDRLAALRVVAWATLLGLGSGALSGVVVPLPLSALALVFGLIGAFWALLVAAAFCVIAGVPLRPSAPERPVRSGR